MHVRKGCLARLRQDIRSDGSRIEGSHKGWNSLQRSFASGIELITALAHDFVLRRNCRIAAISKHPSAFSMSSYGTHHVRLVNHIAGLWNALLAGEKGKGKAELEPLPGLCNVESGEQFGLVTSRYTSSFKGLLEIKEEYKEEDEFGLSSLGDPDLVPTLDTQLQLHNNTSSAASDVHDHTITTPHDTTIISPIPPPLSEDALESAGVNATSVQAKRKSIHSDGLYQSNDQVAIKRPRFHGSFETVNAIVSLAQIQHWPKHDLIFLRGPACSIGCHPILLKNKQ